MQNKIQTLDDVNDLAIRIVDKLVEENIVENCIDTDNELEFDIQDVITEILCNTFNIKNN